MYSGHCKTLAPILAKAAEALAEFDLHVAKVDCTTNGFLRDAFGVTAYPTIKFVRDGMEIEYDGQRSVSGITDYVK